MSDIEGQLDRPFHLVSIDDLDEDWVRELVVRASQFKAWRNSPHPSYWPRHELEGCLLITDFYEPSTRTRLSFEAAMAYMGGRVIGTENAAEFSSAKKGESIADNFEVISGYCDIIVGRFRHEGEARIAADASLVPLINGGDGTGEHPTQALIDWFTIVENLVGDKPARPSSLTLTFVGDNRRSRTVRSLAKLVAMFGEFDRVNFVSPIELAPEPELVEMLRAAHISVLQYNWMDPAIFENSDVVYVTRSQNERSDQQYDGGDYALTPLLADAMPEDSIIMHPLPRNTELPVEIDLNPRAVYFEQARNGLFVRMAILEALIA